MPSIDPLKLQRLVDGELELNKIQSLVKKAETNPDQWRQIATAFIEDRVWQSSFRSPSEADLDSDLATILKTKTAQEFSGTRAGADLPQKNSIDYSRSMKSRSTNPSGRWWLSLAAAMMLALSIGYMVAQIHNDRTNVTPLVASDETPSLNQNHTVYRPDYRLQFEDPDGKTFKDAEVPLFYADRARKLGVNLKPHVVSSEIIDAMRKSGYQMNQDIRYVSGRTADGEQFVVPIRRIKFAPGQ